MRRPFQVARWLILVPTLMYGVFPLFADLGPTHAFHPDWPGHARFHVVWLISLTSALAILATYMNLTSSLAKPRGLQNAGLIGICVTGTFWIAGFTRNLYGGLFGDPNVQPSVLGFEPNLIVFAIEFISLSVGLILATRHRRQSISGDIV